MRKKGRREEGGEGGSEGVSGRREGEEVKIEQGREKEEKEGGREETREKGNSEMKDEEEKGKVMGMRRKEW